MNPRLGIAQAVRAAIHRDSDHWTLYLDGARLNGKDWLRTPAAACLSPATPADRDFWAMAFWQRYPHLSPRRTGAEL